VRYDAVVVGGGPAGSTCARVLAQRGARVLLLEKRRFPRPKLCGGCLSERISPYLPEGWRRLVLNEIRGGVLSLGEEFVEKEAGERIANIVDREGFDLFLLKEARRAGAEVREGVELTGFEGEGPLRVLTTEGEVRTDFLVGADGFHSRVRKLLGCGRGRYFRSVELWTDFPLDGKVIVEIGVVSRGYLWIFPKGERASVGLATAGPENPLRVLKERLRSHPLLGRVEVKGAKGWMIPFVLREEELELGRGRVLLVGDAGGLVDPLLGEGVFYAVRSGILAGELLSEGDPEGYRRAVREEILPELVYAGKIADLAYRFQGVAFRMGKGYALDRLFKLLRGEESFRGVYRKGLPEFALYALRVSAHVLSHTILDRLLRR